MSVGTRTYARARWAPNRRRFLAQSLVQTPLAMYARKGRIASTNLLAEREEGPGEPAGWREVTGRVVRVWSLRPLQQNVNPSPHPRAPCLRPSLYARR